MSWKYEQLKRTEKKCWCTGTRIALSEDSFFDCRSFWHVRATKRISTFEDEVFGFSEKLFIPQANYRKIRPFDATGTRHCGPRFHLVNTVWGKGTHLNHFVLPVLWYACREWEGRYTLARQNCTINVNAAEICTSEWVSALALRTLKYGAFVSVPCAMSMKTFAVHLRVDSDLTWNFVLLSTVDAVPLTGVWNALAFDISIHFKPCDTNLYCNFIFAALFALFTLCWITK